jgi:hypothetical protein
MCIQVQMDCLNEYQHCTWLMKTKECDNKQKLAHKMISEQSPDWWTRSYASLYSPVLSVSLYLLPLYRSLLPLPLLRLALLARAFRMHILNMIHLYIYR